MDSPTTRELRKRQHPHSSQREDSSHKRKKDEPKRKGIYHGASGSRFTITVAESIPSCHCCRLDESIGQIDLKCGSKPSHFICIPCFTNRLLKPECPQCREPNNLVKETEARKKIDIKLRNHTAECECKWKGKVVDIPDHEQVCKNKFPCINQLCEASERTPKRLIKHRKTCIHEKEPCPYCQTLFTRTDLEDHKEECLDYEESIDNTTISRGAKKLLQVLLKLPSDPDIKHLLRKDENELLHYRASLKSFFRKNYRIRPIHNYQAQSFPWHEIEEDFEPLEIESVNESDSDSDNGPVPNTSSNTTSPTRQTDGETGSNSDNGPVPNTSSNTTSPTLRTGGRGRGRGRGREYFDPSLIKRSYTEQSYVKIWGWNVRVCNCLIPIIQGHTSLETMVIRTKHRTANIQRVIPSQNLTATLHLERRGAGLIQ